MPPLRGLAPIRWSRSSPPRRCLRWGVMPRRGRLVTSTVPAPAVVVDGIAAVVNGEVVTRLELEKAGRVAVEERLRGRVGQERVHVVVGLFLDP